MPERERLRPFLAVNKRRCGQWGDHRQEIDRILHRLRSTVQWRDLPERHGPRKTVYARHRLWSDDGTWEQLLQQVQAAADTGQTRSTGTVCRLHRRPRPSTCSRRPHRPAANPADVRFGGGGVGGERRSFPGPHGHRLGGSQQRCRALLGEVLCVRR
ncbi:transposase [Streptomyces sp. SP18CS02]|uniref:transposase n=1 Tax=Streptomyces sp. SP18CS02 TaxID=3002531 RepID=UPI003FCD2EEC